MYELYEAGEFGNRFECWPTLAAYLESGYEEPISIRHRTNGLSGFFYYALSREEIIATIKRLGLTDNDIHLTAGDSGLKRTVQGEVTLTEDGYYLYYSNIDLDMRRALAREGQVVTGLKAKAILETFMDVPSYENLQDLLERYENPVIEFTCFTKGCGILGWNTVTWEVRHY